MSFGGVMMNKKSKIILLISVCIFIIVNAIFTIYIFSNNAEFTGKTGGYYYKIDSFAGDDGKKAFKWDISIPNNETKRNIIANEKNSSALDKFSSAIDNISTKKVSIFYTVTYLILILVVLGIFWNDKKSYNTGYLKGFFTATAFFLIYKIMVASVELSQLLRSASNYYNRIS